MKTACTGLVEPVERDITFERIDLASKSIAPHGDIDARQRQRLAAGSARIKDLAGQQDHARACAVGGQPVGQPGAQRLQQVELAQQMAHRGGLPTGNHQPVDGVEFAAAPHADRVGSRITQRRQVLPDVALQRQYADARATHWPDGRWSLGKRVSPSCMTAATISPYWLKILPWHSERPPHADGEDWS